MPVDQVVGVGLRQAGSEDLEPFATVAGAGDHQPPIDGNALLILLRGNEPGGIGFGGVCRNGEAETGGAAHRAAPASACLRRH